MYAQFNNNHTGTRDQVRGGQPASLRHQRGGNAAERERDREGVTIEQERRSHSTNLYEAILIMASTTSLSLYSDSTVFSIQSLTDSVERRIETIISYTAHTHSFDTSHHHSTIPHALPLLPLSTTFPLPNMSTSVALSSLLPSSLVGSVHQSMESSLVDLMQTFSEFESHKAKRKREEDERRRRIAAAAAAAAANTAQLQEAAQLTKGVYGVHARTPSHALASHAHSPHSHPHSSPHHAHPSPTHSIPPPIPEPSPSEIAATFANYLPHFHHLSHLVASLPISSLERLIQFLQPSLIEQDEPGNGSGGEQNSNDSDHCTREARAVNGVGIGKMATGRLLVI